MSQTELIEQLCTLLEVAAQIIRKQAAIIAQQDALDCAAGDLIEEIEGFIGGDGGRNRQQGSTQQQEKCTWTLFKSSGTG